MADSRTIRIILASDDSALVELFEPVRVQVDPTGNSVGDLLVLDTRTWPVARDAAALRHWRERPGELHRPVLALVPRPGSISEWLDAGADACLVWPSEPATLQAQVRALSRSLDVQHRLSERAARVPELNRQLQELYRQSERDLELTYRLARQYVSGSVAPVGRIQFGVYHRPHGRIGGDFHGLVRLDEEHVGLYLADAMGRGPMTSGLLSLFLRQRMIFKEVIGRSYRLVEPDELLGTLDVEMRALAMEELPLVSMACARLNCQDGQLTYSRAASPAPLIVPRGGEPHFHEGESGPFLGSTTGTFPRLLLTLRPGDRVIFHSDGVRPADMPDAAERLCQAARREHPELRGYVDQIASTLLTDQRCEDDFTLLGVQYDE